MQAYIYQYIKKQGITITGIIFFSILFNSGFYNSAKGQQGFLDVAGEIDCPEGTDGTVARLIGENSSVDSLQIDWQGNFDFRLLLNKEYVIEFSKSQYLPQRILISTKVPEGQQHLVWTIAPKYSLKKTDSINQIRPKYYILAKYKFYDMDEGGHFYTEAEYKTAKQKAKTLSVEEKMNVKKENANPLDSVLADLVSDGILEPYQTEYVDPIQLKKLEKEIQELNNLKRKTHQDSMLLLQKSVSIQQQLVNNEKYQLQVDRLNARSKEDSSLILEREKRILFADQAIANAQNRIKLKNFEIKNQRIILISSISGLVLTLVLFIILFTSFRQKKKFSKQLERQNRELEIQGQGLEKANYLLSMQNLEITASINYAKRIQEAILPAAKKVKDHFEDYFLIYKPKDIVSGDFYWMERMDNKIYFALIDCTGHGVPGAFMSIIGNRLFNEVFFTKKITDPAQFLEALDIGIKEILRQEVTENNDGMDVCFCCFERIEDNKLKVRFAGAKRPLFYYMTDKDEIALLKGDRKPIGGKYYHDVIFTNKEIILTKGDVLYLTSDGYTDQNGPEMKKLGTKRLVDILKENATKPMSVQKKALETELDTHQEGEDQRDDITIIGIKL